MSLIERAKRLWKLSAPIDYERPQLELSSFDNNIGSTGVQSVGKAIFIPRISRDPVKEIVNENV